MAAITMVEASQFIAAIAALIGAGIGLVKLLFWQAERRSKKWIGEMIADNLLQSAADAGVAKTRGIDVAFHEFDVELRIPVILDQWLPLPWGFYICGVDFAKDSTSYLIKCEATARLLSHTHEGTESVQVIRGRMTDLSEGGKVYGPGDVWMIPAKTSHQVHFDAPLNDTSFLALVTVTPPLPNPNQAPLDLKDLPKLLDPRRRHARR